MSGVKGRGMNWRRAKNVREAAYQAVTHRRFYPMRSTPPERDIPPRSTDPAISLPRVSIVERYNEDGSERT